MTYSTDESVTGQDARLKWGSEEFAVSNVSWSRDINTTEVQHNDDLNAKILTTGLRFSGSFEYNGRNWDLMNALVHATGDAVLDKNEPRPGTMTIQETHKEDLGNGESYLTKYIYTFKGVIVTGQSRDLPADDAASTSWDWQAEKMSVKKKG